MRGSEVSVLLSREKESVWIEKEPLPLRRAALVRVFRAPFISRGLNAANVVKRETKPSMEMFVRSGRDGMFTGFLVGVADILLV
jgi:hypothetical protein